MRSGGEGAWQRETEAVGQEPKVEGRRKFLSVKAFFVMHCNLRVIFKALGETWKCYCNNSGNNNCNCNNSSSNQQQQQQQQKHLHQQEQLLKGKSLIYFNVSTLTTCKCLPVFQQVFPFSFSLRQRISHVQIAHRCSGHCLSVCVCVRSYACCNY